jgi:hypothetical protein
MADPRSRGLAVGALVAGALLLAGAVLVVTLVPLVPCKGCVMWNHFEEKIRREGITELVVYGHDGMKDFVLSRGPLPTRPFCRACGNTGKMTLLRKWLVLRSEPQP